MVLKRLVFSIFFISCLAIQMVSAQTTVTLYPGKDARLMWKEDDDSYESSNYSAATTFAAYDWKWSGQEVKMRGILQFDLGQIPAEAVIDSAFLYLYGQGHNTTYRSNASNLYILDHRWNETTVTWNNHPDPTDDYVTLPASTSSTQNYKVDLTSYVEEWTNHSRGNFGMLLKLANETYYTSMSFYSSEYEDDTTKRPKLMIYYTIPAGTSSLTYYPDIDAIGSYYVNHDNYITNYGQHTLIKAERWTSSSQITKTRSVIKMNFPDIPEVAEIEQATLYLYNPDDGSIYTEQSSYSGPNSSKLYRMLQNWDEKTINWYWLDGSSRYSSTDYVALPTSISARQDYPVNVTSFVKNWRNGTYPNYGLCLQLDDESSFRRMCFASSDNQNYLKHPKLVIDYVPFESRSDGDLEAFYVFTEGEGNFVNDVSGNNHNLYVENYEVSSWGTDATYSAYGTLYLDETSRAFSIDPITSMIDNIKNTNEFTFEAWVYAPTQEAADGHIMSVVQPDGTVLFKLKQQFVYSNTYTFTSTITTSDNPSGVTTYFTGSKQNDQPYVFHLVVTKDAAGNAKLFLNGVLSETATISGNLSNWNSNSELRLANNNSGGGLSIVSVFSNALKEAYVAELYDWGRANTTSTTSKVVYSKSAFVPNQDVNLYEAHNYIHTVTPREAIGGSLPADGDYSAVQGVQYFDGLGRLEQEIAIHASPSGKDIVNDIYYDEYGRESRQYLPFVNEADGCYTSLRDVRLQDQYVDDPIKGKDALSGAYYYSETIFENSPLNRVTEQGAPGYDWRVVKSGGVSTRTGNTVRMDYGANTASEVYLLEVSGDSLVRSSSAVYYGAGELYVKEVMDENGHVTKEYTDKEGQVVLKKTFEGTDPVETYYVYDDFGLLRYVVPPLASDQLPSSGEINYNSDSLLIKNLSYYYQYDERRRMVEKQLPGAEPVYMVYDSRDRIILTQDGNQCENLQWLFTKYDRFNRPIITGILYHPGITSRDYAQQLVDDYMITIYDDSRFYEELDLTTETGFTCRSFPYLDMLNTPNVSAEYLTITFYDNYDAQSFLGGATFSAPDNTGLSDDIYQDMATNLAASLGCKGLVTGQKTKILGSTGYLASINFYDKKRRLIQVVSDNHLGGTERTSTTYNFVNEPEAVISEHTKDASSSKIIVGERYQYDHTGRLLETYHQVGGQAEVMLAANKYNELGELITKVNHGSSSLSYLVAQKADYRYNARGWLTAINDVDNPSSLENDLFSMKLHYNTTISSLSSTPQYNGNISAIEWTNTEITNKLGYGYTYDDLNRLTDANYETYNGTSWSNDYYFDALDIVYDKNGNIQELLRYNGDSEETMDELTYTYENNGLSNRLLAVYDPGSEPGGFTDGASQAIEYEYDANGNMKKDLNKGISSITYNYLNLPETITKSGTISYFYTAGGTKLQHVNQAGDVTDYIGAFVYKNDALEYILTSEGRVLPDYKYEYHLKDHLGNTRVAFVDRNSDFYIDQTDDNEVVQQSDYYPFGMEHAVTEYNKDDGITYLYNGKELEEELDWYDYGARMYDAALGRWHVIDGMAESHYYFTPYNYAVNNPILFIDLFGLDTTYYGDEIEEVVVVGHKKIESPTTWNYYYFENKYLTTENKSDQQSPEWPTVVADATSTLGFTLAAAKEFQVTTGIKVGQLSGGRYRVYGANFYGNQSTKIVKLTKAVKVGGHIISAIMIGSDVYNVYLGGLEGNELEAAKERLVTDILMTGVYAVNAELGLIVTSMTIIANSTEGQRAIQRAKDEVRERKGIWQLPQGPMYIKQGN